MTQIVNPLASKIDQRIIIKPSMNVSFPLSAKNIECLQITNFNLQAFPGLSMSTCAKTISNSNQFEGLDFLTHSYHSVRMADQNVTTTLYNLVLASNLSSQIGWLSLTNHQECCLSVPRLRPLMHGLWLPACSLI